MLVYCHLASQTLDIAKMTKMLIIFFIVLTRTYAYAYRLSDPEFAPKQYFDLSYSFDNDTIYFPGQKQFELYTDNAKTKLASGITYTAYSYCMAEHGGTHLDAPFHFNTDGWTVDQIPPNHLIDVPAVLIDVEKAVNEFKKPNEFTLTIHHIINHETSSGMIPFGSVVLIYTGWSQFWPDKVKYLGWDNSTRYRNATLSFPGVSEIAAKWLVSERHILGLGLDTASIDPGNSKTFPAHAAMAHQQIYNLENVANLHLLSNATKNCSLRLFILPLKIAGGTGAPVRILAYCK